MLHLALYGLLAVIIAGGLFLVATRFLPAGEQIAPSMRDEVPWQLPGGRPLDAADIDSVRLPVALRGYRFAETDVLLDRLAAELTDRDLEIARLRGQDGALFAASEAVAPGAAAPDAAADDEVVGAPPSVGGVEPPADPDAPFRPVTEPPQPPPSDDDELPVTEGDPLPGTGADDRA